MKNAIPRNGLLINQSVVHKMENSFHISAKAADQTFSTDLHPMNQIHGQERGNWVIQLALSWTKTGKKNCSFKTEADNTLWKTKCFRKRDLHTVFSRVMANRKRQRLRKNTMKHLMKRICENIQRMAFKTICNEAALRLTIVNSIMFSICKAYDVKVHVCLIHN